MAKFNFLNLNDEIRSLMRSEIERDLKGEILYLSNRLNDKGNEVYCSLLLAAVEKGDEESFEISLDQSTYFNPMYLRQGKPVKMPTNACALLCQSEFNRYYIRAVCLKAIASGVEEVEIYRGRESSWTRVESEAKIGSKLSAKELLEDLRSSIGVEPKILPEVNSGLSVKI